MERLRPIDSRDKQAKLRWQKIKQPGVESPIRPKVVYFSRPALPAETIAIKSVRPREVSLSSAKVSASACLGLATLIDDLEQAINVDGLA
jgi:hypothetical protein